VPLRGGDRPGIRPRFFGMLDPGEGTGELLLLLNRVEAAGNPGKHTFFAALVSVAAEADLFLTFRDTYHFPWTRTCSGTCCVFSNPLQAILTLRDGRPGLGVVEHTAHGD